SLPFPSVPRSAGQKESLEVADLAPGIWHFGVKAADEIPNWSALSNVASTTVADTVPVQLKRDTLRLHSMEQGGITDEQETSSTDVRAGREGSNPAPAFGRQDGRFRPV